MRSLKCQVLAISFALVSGASATAQEALFDASDYGKANLSVRQTTGDAAAFIAASKGGAFEPISELSPNDWLATLAQPVGRVDVLLQDTQTGERGASTCTGALIGGGMVLTNDHCMPRGGQYEILEASLLLNYHTLDGVNAARFAMEPVALEQNPDLDYAIVRVDPAAETKFGHVALGPKPQGAGDARIVIHHPLGRPKVMSRFRCLVLNDRSGPPVVPHRCDTLPGSSGSLLFDERGVAVALHRAGGLDASDPTSFNMAIDIGTILQYSAVLSQTPAAQVASSVQAAPQDDPATDASATVEQGNGALTTDQMNNILTSE